MADQKLTALTEDTALVGDDLVYVVIDTAGTPTSRKAKVSTVRAPDAITFTVTPSGADPDFIFLLPPQYVQPFGGAKTLFGSRCATAITFKSATATVDTDVEVVTGGFGWSSTLTSLTSMEAANLFYAGSIELDASALATLDLSSLTYVTGTLKLNAIDVVDVSLPSLLYVGGLLQIANSTVTETIDLPLVEYINEIYMGDSSSLTDISIPSLLGTSSAVYCANCALTQTSVDHILVQLASLDGTGGTTSFDNLSVDLSGGTNASPSATGLTAKTTLEGRGCTVTVN